jgi:hypothetical protein
MGSGKSGSSKPGAAYAGPPAGATAQ